MTTYFDTGILLKLYTAEAESKAVQDFVRRRGEPLRITDLHQAECASALRLKAFRGDCTEAESTRALKLIADDLRNGVLRMVAVDWNAAWEQCRRLAEQHAADTGARTLDTLHVACAAQLGAVELATSDRRQTALAVLAGLKPIDPTGSRT